MFSPPCPYMGEDRTIIVCLHYKNELCIHPSRVEDQYVTYLDTVDPVSRTPFRGDSCGDEGTCERVCWFSLFTDNLVNGMFTARIKNNNKYKINIS